MSKKVLCLLAHGFEEIEAVSPIDILRRAGAEVVIASIEDTTTLEGRSGIRLLADALLDEVKNQSFDLLLIPGGPGVKALRKDGRAAELARKFDAAKKPVAAICAAPTVLLDAGLLRNRRYTSHFSVSDELPDSLSEELVVIDDHIITSRGAGTAIEFGLALVNMLFGEAKRQEIAVAIMH